MSLILTQLSGFGGGGAASKTQAEYDTHAATRGTDKGTVAANGMGAITSFFASAGTFRFVLSATSSTGVMFGSSWGHYATDDSSSGRFVLHALPSAAIMAQLAGASQSAIICVVDNTSTSDTPSVARNGHTSTDYSAPFNSYRMTEITYWDTALGKAQTLNPYTSTGPVDYTW